MLGLLLIGAGTGLSMLSQYQSGRAQDAMAKYNAEVSRQQAEAQARAIEAEARLDADVDRAQMGSLRAKMASRGIDYESGSPLLVAAQLARDNAYDQFEMKREADIARITGQVQGDMYKWEGTQARKQSLLNMTATGIKGAGAMYGSYQAGKVPVADKIGSAKSYTQPTLKTPSMPDYSKFNLTPAASLYAR